MKKTKVEKGITLVALIITIIVLLILAVVAINAVQNDGIIEYAKNARYEHQNAQDDEQVTLDYYLSQLQSSTGNGIVHGGVLQGEYIKATGEKLEKGKKFPSEPQEGDVYIYGDYEYKFNYSCNSSGGWSKVAGRDGWGIRILDSVGKEQTSYGEILTTINNKDVKSFGYVFKDCTRLKIAPNIPDTVIAMAYAFKGCTDLMSVPNIPNSVTKMQAAFAECINLISIPKLPDGVENMSATFQGCTALTTVPNIPRDANDVTQTFLYCSNLTGDIIVETRSLTGSDLCFADTTQTINLIGVGETIGADGKKVYENDGVLTTLMGTANNGNVEIVR